MRTTSPAIQSSPDGCRTRRVRGHELHADADTEERLGALDHFALQGVDHARHAIEAGTAVGEGADALSTIRSAVATSRGLEVTSTRSSRRFACGALESLAADRRLPEP